MARARIRIGRALDRYVFGEFARTFVITALGFPVLVIVMDLVQNLDRYLERHVRPAALALSYAYWLPETMFEALPAAVLFAAVFTIGAVTRHSEITAAKASGISFYRFILPIAVGGVLATGLGLVLGELAPPWNAKRLALIGDTKRPEGHTRTHFAYTAESGRVYRAARLDVDSASLVVVEVERRGTGADYPTQLISAARAKWRASDGWTLRKGTMHVLPSDTIDAAFVFDSLVERHMLERPRDLMLTPKAPEDMNYAELGRFIRAQARSGVDVNALRVSRMLKITIPVTCVIILLFAAPLATSTQRGGAAFGVGLSLGTTVVFLVLIQLTRAIGGKGMIAPGLAAWIPSVMFGLAGLVLMARTRT